MKKSIVALVAAVALVLLAVPTIAFASGMHQAWSPAGGTVHSVHHAIHQTGKSAAATAVEDAIASTCAYFQRTADGVDDSNAGVQTSCPGYVDENGDGLCDHCSNGQSSCPGYLDADGDGVCDNSSNGRGACSGYVDADNDGVCDNYGTGACDGVHGHGCGNGYGYGNGSGSGHGYGHHGCMRR